MTHQMLLATLVLTGVFTEDELTEFLEWDKINVRHSEYEKWPDFVKQVREWKAKQ